MSEKLTQEQYTQAKGMVSMMLAITVAKRMDEEGYFEKIKAAETPEAKLEAIHESERAIQKEFGLAFQSNDQAQQMKREVFEEYIKHHYEYFGFTLEDAIGLEG